MNWILLMDCGLPGSSVHGVFPGKNIRVTCCAFHQGIFPTQGLNPGLPHCSQTLVSLIFFQGISSLSFSIVSLYFFVLIAEEGFLISPCYSLELYIQMLVSFLSSLPFLSLLFTATCKASSDNHFAFLHFFFLGIVLITASCTMS